MKQYSFIPLNACVIGYQNLYSNELCTCLTSGAGSCQQELVYQKFFHVQRLHLATIAIRDTAHEVNETVKDLKEGGTIKDIASAVVETIKTALNTIDIVKAAIYQKTLPKDAYVYLSKK